MTLWVEDELGLNRHGTIVIIGNEIIIKVNSDILIANLEDNIVGLWVNVADGTASNSGWLWSNDSAIVVLGTTFQG